MNHNQTPKSKSYDRDPRSVEGRYRNFRDEILSRQRAGDTNFARSLSSRIRREFPELLETCFKTTEVVIQHKRLLVPKLYQLLGIEFEGTCKQCGTPVKFNGNSMKPRDFCSVACAQQNPTVRCKVSSTHNMKSREEKRRIANEAKKTRNATYEREWGGLHPMQTQDVLLAHQKSCFSLKPFTDRRGRVHLYQGYEDVVLRMLDSDPEVSHFFTTASGKLPSFVYKSRVVKVGKRPPVYHPDIGVVFKSGQRLLIEVKSDHTLGGVKNPPLYEVNRQKFIAADAACKAQVGCRFRVVIVPSKGNGVVPEDIEVLSASAFRP